MIWWMQTHPKRLTIALENRLLKKNHPQYENENVVRDLNDSAFRKKFLVFCTNWNLTETLDSDMQIRP